MFATEKEVQYILICLLTNVVISASIGCPIPLPVGFYNQSSLSPNRQGDHLPNHNEAV